MKLYGKETERVSKDTAGKTKIFLEESLERARSSKNNLRLKWHPRLRIEGRHERKIVTRIRRLKYVIDCVFCVGWCRKMEKFFVLPDFPTPPSPSITHLNTRGPIRLFWDLLVVKDVEMISLLDELPTLFADFFDFFLPFRMSDDILLWGNLRQTGKILALVDATAGL